MSGAFEAKLKLEMIRAKKEPLRDVCLGGLDGLVNAGRIKRIWVDDPQHGIRFLSSTDILKSDLSDLRLISHKAIQENPKLMIKQGWILITRAGTIGRMAYARHDMDGMACSEDVLRIIPDNQKILSGYLFAYLRCKFGVPLVVGGTYGAIIQHIEPQHIAGLPVPRLGVDVESQVHQLITNAAARFAQAQSLYQQATRRALEYAGLPELSPAQWHSRRAISFSTSIDSYSRLRALSYEPRLQQIIALVQKGRHATLGSLLSRPPFRPNRFSRIDVDPGLGIQLVGQREMFFRRWDGRWISASGVSNQQDLLAPAGTIALACIGTLGEHEVYGRVVRVRPAQALFALSDNVLQLRVDNTVIPSGYLFALLRSETYFRSFRCLSVGGKQQVLHPIFLSEIPIPLAPRPVMDTIDSDIREADSLCDHALTEEDTAIRLVEAEIEKGAHDPWPK